MVRVGNEREALRLAEFAQDRVQNRRRCRLPRMGQNCTPHSPQVMTMRVRGRGRADVRAMCAASTSGAHSSPAANLTSDARAGSRAATNPAPSRRVIRPLAFSAIASCRSSATKPRLRAKPCATRYSDAVTPCARATCNPRCRCACPHSWHTSNPSGATSRTPNRPCPSGSPTLTTPKATGAVLIDARHQHLMTESHLVWAIWRGTRDLAWLPRREPPCYAGIVGPAGHP